MTDLQSILPWIIGACIIILIIGILIFFHTRKKIINTTIESNSSFLSTADEEMVTTQEEPQDGLAIKLEALSALTNEEEKRLIEIHDEKLLARVDSVIPGVFQAIANAGAVHHYNQAVQSAGQLYRAIIPKSAVLTQSRSMDGAVRGFFRGAKNIRGHANLIPVDGNSGSSLAAMSTVNAAMGVASMVVGQYYMTQINNKLDSISEDIKQMAGFQNNEYTSKIYALIAEVQKSSIFRTDTMENDELRNRELMHLQNLEHECAELLGQANLTIQDFAKKTELSYEDYEKAVAEANKWYQYQHILLEIMGKIGELTYTLNLGAVSKDYCNAMYVPYSKQAEVALVMLNEWHNSNTKRFEIDTVATKRKRQGFDGFLMSIPAIFNDGLNYLDISKHTAKMINQQSNVIVRASTDSDSDYFIEDVELVVKDGKLYYMPPAIDHHAS